MAHQINHVFIFHLDASEMDFGKQVEQGKAKVTIDVSNHRNTLKEKVRGLSKWKLVHYNLVERTYILTALTRCFSVHITQV